MVDNQYAYDVVMAEVLAGQFYWTLDGGYAENTGGPNHHSVDEDDFIYTRCVRDLDTDEIAKINKFE